MRRARSALRLGALTAWTLACFAAWLLAAPLAVLAAHLPAWRARVQHVWSRGMCRILGVRLAVAGRTPRGACLLVANHLSYLDVLALGALLPCAFVAKAEVARWPLVGFLARAMGTLFIQRENRRALGQLNARLALRLGRGETLVLFPEGTSTSGSGVLAFRSALLQPAAELGIPVCYAALCYATAPGERPASEVVCWWGDMAFLAHFLKLLGLERIEATVSFGAEPIRAADRKLLAARLQSAVVERLEPLPRHA